MSYPHLLGKPPGKRLAILLLIMLVSWGLGLYFSVSSRHIVFNPPPLVVPRQPPDLTTERLTGLIAARRHVGFLAFSPDGRTLGLPKRDGGRVELWNLDTGKEQVLVSPFNEGAAAASRIAFSGDGRMLAVYYARRGVALWDLSTKRDPWFLPNGLHTFVHDMAFAQGDRNLVTLMGRDAGPNQKADQWDYSADFWEVSTGKKLGTDVFDPTLLFKALSRDGRYAVMQKLMEGQMVFELATAKGAFTVDGSGEFAFSDDVSTLVSYDGKQARVWDIPSGKELKRFVFRPSYCPDGYSVYTGCLSVSSDKRLMAVGNFRKTNAVGVISLETGKHLGEFQSGPYPMMSHVVLFSPDGRILAIDNQPHGITDNLVQPLLRLWRIPESW
jgi:WD40 repeat protein